MMFASDNWAGACPEIQQALGNLDATIAPAYGGDELSALMDKKLSELFETPVRSITVSTGSAANALALGVYAKPASITLSHISAHVNADEYNGPERVNPGLKIIGLEGIGGKISTETLAAKLALFPDGISRQGRLTCLSLTQTTEFGQAYSVEEVRQLSDCAKTIGLGVHMDGARFSNAVAYLGCSPADITWRAGVDLLSLGFTKNGAWCADILVFFGDELPIDATYLSHQMGQNFSKPRFIASQVLTMLENDLWLDNAHHANRQADYLATGLIASNKSSVPLAPQGNEVFAYFAQADIDHLQKLGAQFYPWPEDDVPTHLREQDRTLMRMVCSFATSSVDVEKFLSGLN